MKSWLHSCQGLIEVNGLTRVPPTKGRDLNRIVPSVIFTKIGLIMNYGSTTNIKRDFQ